MSLLPSLALPVITMSPTNNRIDSEEILDRAVMRANRAMFTIQMQSRRIASTEPEDAIFLGRQIADFEFLVVATTRLRRAAELGRNAPETATLIAEAIKQFDKSLPGLKKLRDIAEHIDDYSVDQERIQNVDRRYLENCMVTGGGKTWSWLGEQINIDDISNASGALFRELRRAQVQVQELAKNAVHPSRGSAVS